jgi:transmembrane sensor
MPAGAICIKRFILKLDEIQTLIDKYLSGTATPAERTEVEQWYENAGGLEGQFSTRRLGSLKAGMRKAIFSKLSGADENLVTPLKSRNRQLFGYVRWAAAIVIVCFGIGLYYYSGRQPEFVQLAKHRESDIGPGRNRATLTLSDGSVLVLDSANHGQLAQISGTSVSKTADGLLSYHTGTNADAQSLVYNSISIPRGGKYAVVLADGTKVWLNAATTLKYPIAFAGNERRVELSGEAYFEVAKNASKPFRVTSKGQTVEVLGTHFNISGYAEEGETRSTLLEGSIKISNGSQNELLKPGQQAIINNVSADQAIQINSNINTEEVIAWKNDLFQFENADIKTIMNQIGRWYDVEIVYENKISEGHYRGKVSRNSNLSTALKILETSGINFKIEGRKIIVK